MRNTVKNISETLFDWLVKLKWEESNFFPEVIESWNDKDWMVAKRVVFIHGMGPLWGSYCLGGWYCEKMPEEFRNYLIQQYRQNGIRIAKIQNSYKKIKKTFFESNIAFIPFKGIDLAHKIYADPAVRPMADIDLYVHRANRENVFEIFSSLDFYPSAVTESGVTFYPKDWLDSQSGLHKNVPTDLDSDDELYQGENPNSPFSVDVHFEIKIRNLPSFTQAFEDSLPDINNLPTSYYFIYLLSHAGKHFLGRSGRWLQLYDICLFSQFRCIDYEEVADLSVRLGVAHLILVPLILCQSIFGELRELETLLSQRVGWRHKMLMRKLQLSEMSCCNPWEVSPLSQFAWASGVREIRDLFIGFKNRDKEVLVNHDSALLPIPSAGKRLLRIGQKIFRKVPRESWILMASLRLNPRLHWK